MHPPIIREQARSGDASLRAILILTLAVAAALRFWGLRQGIPFALGVDEPEVMDRAVRMMRTGDFNPHFYDYPALYMYLQAGVAVLRFVWGAMHAQWASLSQAPTEAFYLWGRAFTAILGTLTVAVVFRAGLRWGVVTGTIAAALFAVMPLHVRESHYTLTDVPMTFFVAMTLLATLRACERPSAARFALAGAAAGLAAATKYNGVLALLMPMTGIAACAGLGATRMKTVALTVAACVATFFIAAPYTVLDLPGFLNGFGRLANMYRLNPTGPEPVAITYAKHLRIALGWTGSVVALAGVLYAAWRAVAGPARARWAVAVLFPIVYFAFVSRQHIVYARYLLPLLPFLALLAGAAVEAALAWLHAERAHLRLRVAAAIALVLMVLVPPAITSAGFARNAGKVWTTELAYGWIRSHVPAGAPIVIESRALVFSDTYPSRNVAQLRLAPDLWSADYLVASSQCYGPYVDSPTTYPAEYADYARIFRQTQEVARFSATREHPGPELRVLKVMR